MKTLSVISRNWIDVPAPTAAVFSFLADIEHLPRWAPEVFERIEIGRDGWHALTCFGEMKLELTTDARSGFIYLQAGFVAAEFAVFSFWLTARPADVTRVRLASFLAEGTVDERHEQIYRLLTMALHKLTAEQVSTVETEPTGARFAFAN